MHAMHTHLKIRPHDGTEATVREIYLKMFVLGILTEDIVAALEKHSSRYGVPRIMS